MKVGDLIRETHAWTPLRDLVKVKNGSIYLVVKTRQDIENGALIIRSVKNGVQHILRPRTHDAQCYEVINESR
jgi:hypothetical protein